ncbi:surfeit locus protein 1-like [Haliotis rubra]|uniref:surfeit locus protein 1-like n=1 Tax=Haliotis rubra TaxID=36100 RepID=UPI001EE55AB9|nr:surfeit locus protein 1-like [Haliotis rubra]
MTLFSRSSSFLWNLRRGHILIFRCQSTQQTPRQTRAYKKKKTFGEGGYALLVIPAAAFCLGTWQIQRRKWKLGLISDLEKKTTQPPVPLPLDFEELKDLEYRSVTVRGRFDHSREMYIAPRSNVMTASQGGLINTNTPSPGSNVVTPFILSDRDLTILVNRGWVPAKNQNPATRPEGQISDEVEIVGVVRHDDQRNPFMPKGNHKTSGFWLYRSVTEMSQAAGTAPVFIDADRYSTVNGGPIGGQTRVTLRNEHMSYIITWFSLGLITSLMWYRRYYRPPPPDSAFTYIKKQR